jgi:uncharacterized protein
MNDDCALVVFAKAPVAGYAKTRLAVALGEEGAARLAARMLDETIQQAIASAVGPVELCCTPDMAHPAFISAHKRYGITLTQQVEGDLGIRIRCAMERVMKKHHRALLFGTDAPQLDPAYLRQAADALRTLACVFAPVSDGGYVLVGLARRVPPLFDGIAWGTNQVMHQTRDRIAACGITCAELPILNDVDEADDLVHVPTGWLK